MAKKATSKATEKPAAKKPAGVKMVAEETRAQWMKRQGIKKVVEVSYVERDGAAMLLCLENMERIAVVCGDSTDEETLFDQMQDVATEIVSGSKR